MDSNPDFKLSLDMMVHVLRFLDPVNILAMRATCRFFYRTAASRSVWIAALYRVCEQHGVYKPTYPVEKMTLAELEHAASGPRRFIKFISRSNSGSSKRYTGPYVTRRYPCRREANQDGLHTASHLALVPGGRFLFTAEGSRPKDAAPASVCLWDLGYNMHCPANPFPVATISIPKMDIPHLSYSPCSHGSEIILAVAGRLFGINGGRLLIFSIDPLRQPPGFALYHEKSLLDAYSPPRMALGQSIMVLMSGKTIYVVNWTEKRG
ncbi:hypothetical protein FA13DRAFT_825885 [Coprinellus micaceus]|uniref:F-box domain-containing protein n=1 Tax=Coprinellus micaceus TaxID=71717 RepID=A0A4Y7T1J6_COPMI|nr:hypothetical protein FA13DRAFT_825885 [Coprinellus micaceus]